MTLTRRRLNFKNGIQAKKVITSLSLIIVLLAGVITPIAGSPLPAAAGDANPESTAPGPSTNGSQLQLTEKEEELWHGFLNQFDDTFWLTATGQSQELLGTVSALMGLEFSPVVLTSFMSFNQLRLGSEALNGILAAMKAKPAKNADGSDSEAPTTVVTIAESVKEAIRPAPNKDSANKSSAVVDPTIPALERALKTGALKGRTIVIDPGHGGSNPGAIGRNGTRESDHNLAISLKLADLLREAGAKVIMTRSTDVDVAIEGKSWIGQLEARTIIANSSGTDLFISVHANTHGDLNIKGTITFFMPKTAEDAKVAQAVQTQTTAMLNARDIGIKKATYYVLRNTRMTSILVEVGFISNAEEEALLAKDWYRTKAAQGIFSGIVDYYSQR